MSVFVSSQSDMQKENCFPTAQVDHKSFHDQVMEQTSIKSNPYCFPENLLFQSVTYNGVAVRKFPVSVDSITQIKRIRNVTMREDDLLIAAFPKCGEFLPSST